MNFDDLMKAGWSAWRHHHAARLDGYGPSSCSCGWSGVPATYKDDEPWCPRCRKPVELGEPMTLAEARA